MNKNAAIFLSSVSLCIYAMDSLDLPSGSVNTQSWLLDDVILRAANNRELAFDYAMFARGLNVQESRDFAEKIKKIPLIERVSFVSVCQLTDDAFAHLIYALYQRIKVRELDVSFSPKLGSDDARMKLLSKLLSSMPSVTIFKFNASGLGCAGYKSVCALTNAFGVAALEEIDLSFCELARMGDSRSFSCLMRTLGGSALKVLRLRGNAMNAFSAEQVYSLAGVVVTAMHLKTLDVASNGIGLPGKLSAWGVFTEALALSGLEELNVSNNWLDASSDELWNGFMCAISCMKKLKRLDMRGNGLSSMSDDRRLKLVEALIRCPSYPVLVLKKQDNFNKCWTRLVEQENRLKIVFEE